MIGIKQHHIRTITRRFWGVFFGCIIAFAVVVQIGRQAFPLMNDYRYIIAESLGTQLGVNVEIGGMSAKWQGLRPEVRLTDLTLVSLDGSSTELFAIENARAELSLFDTVVQRGLAWRTITFDGFQTTFTQREDNSWGIKGYSGGTANTENPFNFDDPLDIFLFGRRVEINSAALSFEFNHGKTTELTIPTIRLENDRFFHRMTAELNIEGKESLRLVIEGYGDPRNKERFSANGYLHLANVPTSDIYNAIANTEVDDTPVLTDTDMEPAELADATLADAMLDGSGLDDSGLNSADLGVAVPNGTPLVNIDQNTLDLELWFKGSPQLGMTAKGHLAISGLPKAFEKVLTLPDQLHADLAGAWREDGSWFFNIQDLALNWAGRSIDLDTFSFYGKGKDIGLRLAQLDVTTLTDVMVAANQERDNKLADAIKQLKPVGLLSNIDISLTSPEEGYFKARARVDGGGAGLFMGSPELANISGFVETSLWGGYVDANVKEGFTLNLAKVFDSPFILDNVSGQLAWRVDIEKHKAYLQSSILSATQGEKNVVGAFAMDIPFSGQYGEPNLSLIVNVDKAKADERNRFLPNKLPKSLVAWLDDAILGGDVKDVEVLYRGSVTKDPSVKPSYQVRGSVDNLHLRYDASWPEITAASGSMFLDSDRFSAELNSGKISESAIHNARVDLERASDGEFFININAGVDGDLSSAKSFLLNSPIKSKVESFLPEWTLSGDYQSELSLSIPLNFDEDRLNYTISSSVDSASALIGQIALPITDIKGDFVYSKNEQARAKDLQAQLWGQDFKFDIQTDVQSKDVITEFSGKLNMAAFKDWARLPELSFVHNDTNINGMLQIPTNDSSHLTGLTLNVNSELEGVAIELPAPLAKTKKQKRAMAFELVRQNDRTIYEIDYSGLLNLHIHALDDSLVSVLAAVGQELPAIEMPAPGNAKVVGHVASLVYDEWMTALDHLLSEQKRIQALKEKDSTQPQVGQASLLTRADFLVDDFRYGDIHVADLELGVVGDADAWVFSGASEEFDGDIRISNSGEPIELDVQYLSLFEDLVFEGGEDPFADAEPVSALADIDLSTIPPMKVKIDSLFLKKQNWGSWRFDINPIENGLHFSKLNANVRKLKLGRDIPADFFWRKYNGKHLSLYVGSVDAINLGDTLEEWELERLLVSSSAHFDVNFSWLEPPDLIALDNIAGALSLDIRNGSFIRGAEAGENPLLRLLALFNFDTLARRLRLDFSDLAAKGFAYDSIRSNMLFADGVATLSEPLIVESSSSKMQMVGTIDLVGEKVDAQLAVTLPVAGNLAVAAAFVGGLPAALGVYVVSKMFDRQVDMVSSIGYTVKGRWEDPKIKVSKIFNDEVKQGKKTPKEETNTVEAVDKPSEPASIELTEPISKTQSIPEASVLEEAPLKDTVKLKDEELKE